MMLITIIDNSQEFFWYFTTKTEIQNFLLANDIFFEETCKKNQLLANVKTFNFQEYYICDYSAAERGHVKISFISLYFALQFIC